MIDTLVRIQVRWSDVVVWSIVAAIIVAFFLNLAWAGPITVTVNATADQELALTVYAQAQADAVAKRNGEATAWNTANPTAPPKPMTPVLTREQWLADQVLSVLAQLSTQHRAKILGSDMRGAFEKARADEKAAICSTLGLTGKLAECP